ncbi:conserved hypothetical protein [Ruegeria lacuscaerulensis ITI-1157]|nr:conserved hypothetical protein [Ruegeria lacuscaerulensis ITI-1157]
MQEFPLAAHERATISGGVKDFPRASGVKGRKKRRDVSSPKFCDGRASRHDIFVPVRSGPSPVYGWPFRSTGGRLAHSPRIGVLRGASALSSARRESM